MTDIADAAHAAEEFDRRLALARWRGRDEEAQVFAPLDLERGRRCLTSVCVPVCRDCALPIEPERLRANPNAVRCVDCQIAHERDHALEKRLYG